MSIPVPLERVRAATAERGPDAYVLTVSDDGRPHVVNAPVRWEGDAMTASVGRRSAANAAARPLVALLYPIRRDDEYSLIIDGSALVAADGDDHRLLITPAKAVLHRPAPSPDPANAPCGSDCVPLLDATKR